MASFCRALVSISALIIFLCLVLSASTPFLRHVNSYRQFLKSSASHSSTTNDFHASKQNVWADLNQHEVNDLLHFLYQDQELNLTETTKATSRDNTIVLLEALHPNKTDILKYLSGSAVAPQRWARIVVAEGLSEVPQVANYMVGPLPLDISAKILPLEYIFNSGRNHAINLLFNRELLKRWLLEQLSEISDIMETLLGINVFPGPDGLDVKPGSPFIRNQTMASWMQFYRKDAHSDASWILPQGLYFKLEAYTCDTTEWKISQWFYNGELYGSSYELRNAMRSSNFQIVPLNLPGSWTDTEEFSGGPREREMPPPVMIQPTGPRYKLDRQANFLSWMGFEFYISTSLQRGISIHNMKFDGDAVFFELGLQEALAHYAGDEPAQGGLAFMDTLFEMGFFSRELVPGYDCPSYADFLSATYHKGEGSVTRKNSICVFEYTADHALQRHTSFEHVSISRNNYLVVRYVATMGNYDYTIEYLLYLDGTIEVKVHASGFIWAAFYPQSSSRIKRAEYGYRVHDALATSMHDHVLNFKIDLDVAGTSNTFTRVGIESVTKDFSWDEETTTPRNTMHLVEHIMVKEGGLNWPSNAGEMYIILNKNSTNAWGEKRGYRIVPGTGLGTPSHLSILNSTALKKSAEWAYKDLWLVKHKDTEPRSAEPLNMFEPEEPLVDFGKFVNGEDIVDEDLVLFFNLGSHHIPHSGDIPNTLMHTSASSVMFSPFNFHDRDPSRERAQGVKLELSDAGTQARYYGGTYREDVQLKATDLEPDLKEYDNEPRITPNWTWMYDSMVAQH